MEGEKDIIVTVLIEFIIFLLKLKLFNSQKKKNICISSIKDFIRRWSEKKEIVQVLKKFEVK